MVSPSSLSVFLIFSIYNNDRQFSQQFELTIIDEICRTRPSFFLLKNMDFRDLSNNNRTFENTQSHFNRKAFHQIAYKAELTSSFHISATKNNGFSTN